MASPRAKPRVFVSYAHESKRFTDRVARLAARLQRDGVEAVLDRDTPSPAAGWPRWIERQLEESDFVLTICTETWYRRVRGLEERGKGLGVRWEGNLIYQYLYNSGGVNTRFVPVLFEDGLIEHVPTPLQGSTIFRLNGEYRKLIEYLTSTAPHEPIERRKPGRIWNVPLAPNPWFTGREQELSGLRTAFTGGGKRAAIQVLSGLGGLGKTQTAVEYAYRYRDEYQAVFWLRADSTESLRNGFAEVAELIGLPRGASPMKWLGSNAGWLVVLDNADDPSLLKDFLPAGAAGHILITSRSSQFQSVGVSQPVALQELGPGEASGFLLTRTGRKTANPEEAQAAADLAAELGFLPLALEQAAAYILSTGALFVDYLAGFRRRRLELLERHQPVAGDYQNSVLTTWAINFAEVEKAAASADLLRISAFLAPDAIPLELIAEGAGEMGPGLAAALPGPDADPLAVNEVLAPLTTYSLIRRDIPSRTYSLHRLVQAVVRDRLSESDRDLWVGRAIAALNRVFPTDMSWPNWPRCIRLMPHALAVAPLIQASRLLSRESCRLVHNAGFFLLVTGRLQEAETLCRQACDLWAALYGPKEEGYGRAMVNLAKVRNALGQFDEAEALFLSALEVLRGFEPYALADALTYLGALYTDRGRCAEAETVLREAVATADYVYAFEALGALLMKQERHEEAAEQYRRSLERFEKSGRRDDALVSRLLSGLAEIAVAQGNSDEAEALRSRSVEALTRAIIEMPDVGAAARNLTATMARQKLLKSGG